MITIVFFIRDYGPQHWPRAQYKRWVYITGLYVPTTLTWLSNIHVEKKKKKRRKRRCHVKHFTSRNGKQILDRSMNLWPHTHTTCQDGIQLGYDPLEKCLELDFLELEESTTYAKSMVLFPIVSHNLILSHDRLSAFNVSSMKYGPLLRLRFIFFLVEKSLKQINK